MRPITALLSLMLSGCAADGVSSLGGDTPPPTNVKATILAHKGTLWKDPESIKGASITEPFRNAMFGSTSWLVCVRMNAKNSFGGYTGESDSLVALDATPYVLHERAVGACGDKPHTAFAELNGDYRPAPAKR